MANPIILDGKSLAKKSNLEIAKRTNILTESCLLYTSDAADE